MNNKDLNTLIQLAEEIAKKKENGELSIFKFKSGWKCAIDIPYMHSGDCYFQVYVLPQYNTLEEALCQLICDPENHTIDWEKGEQEKNKFEEEVKSDVKGIKKCVEESPVDENEKLLAEIDEWLENN
jgi:hypothetical protein